MVMVKRESGLSRTDWVEAALLALEAGGMPAVAVEPLAKQLGATKGSFYWHFKDRADLIDAVVERWERRYITDGISRLSEIDDPRARLERLFKVAVTPGTGRIDVALTEAAKTNAGVAETVRRVQERRVEFLAGIYEQLGLAPHNARQLAVLALLAQVGMAVVAETAPALVPTGAELDTLRSLLTPPV
jgi:AcrR family transcriptional regulator